MPVGDSIPGYMPCPLLWDNKTRQVRKADWQGQLRVKSQSLIDTAVKTEIRRKGRDLQKPRRQKPETKLMKPAGGGIGGGRSLSKCRGDWSKVSVEMNPPPYDHHHLSSHYYPPAHQTVSISSSLQHGTSPAQSQFIYPQFPLYPSPYHRATMTPHGMAEPSELEQMQRLSEGYNPDLPGCLVGDRLPMLHLVTEYSQADPAFVLKTQSLAATHSGYRQIKGDGQCGWRGAVFGYFETLLSVGDLQLVLQEETRLQSFADLMRMAGIDYDIIVDMFDSTWELFADLKTALERGEKGEKVILDPMNDEIRSNSIVYHFKMMTSAYMQLYPGNYEPFLEMPIADYRVSRIDPSNQEIDQIGLQVMTDAVIAPAGFALDVYYLDRSVGAEVTPHKFAPKNAGGPKIGMLYRPGHYDLVYAGTQPVEVYIQSGATLAHNELQTVETSAFSSDVQAYFNSHVSPMTDGSAAHNSMFQGHVTSHIHSGRPTLDEGSYMSAQQFPNTVLHPPLRYDYLQSSQSSSMTSTSALDNPVTQQLSTKNGLPQPIQIQSSHLPPSILTDTQQEDGPRIRPTKYVMEYRRVGESVPLLNTTTGAAAAHCLSHFRNEGFQPQIWKAEEEYTG